MNIDPDAAERLANEVGDERTNRVLEKVRKRLMFEASLPNHPRKKTPDTFFTIESKDCLTKFRSGKYNASLDEERRRSVEASQKAHADGMRPDSDTILGLLEDHLDEDAISEEEQITYEEFQLGKNFLESLEED